ncbi:MAG TPA: hypothetical protein LFW21_01085 [Rickettsia endosymbiont of Pyrocoelia pectoralis]|nr:hypothetical protein [Rickettsia endosymbiont of Pyrocoelia pectoralis]
MADLPKAVSAAKIQEDLKKITKDLQKHDSEIPDPKDIPLGSKESFKDLKDALGKPASNKPLTFEDELARKVKSRQVVDYAEPKIKNTEEKINNHVKRLEELKQKRQDLENRKKELEAKKVNPNISREERWKIAGEIEGINNQVRSVEKETTTIHGAASREKQFDNKSNTQVTKNEPTAADLQQQNAMAAIKRMKDAKKEAEVKAAEPTSKPFNVNPLPPGVIPPPPPLPSGASIPTPPPMPDANKTFIPLTVQKEAKTIAKEIASTDSNQNKHKNELAEAIKKRAEKSGKQNSGRGV